MQQRPVRTLAEAPQTLRSNGSIFMNATELVRGYGLPSDDKTLRAYLEGGSGSA